MREESIFASALEIDDPQSRAEYLDQACANDPSLRAKVQALLAAHDQSGEFLDVPALQQMMNDQSSDPTTVEPDTAQREVDLSFLQPSEVPDSLGRLGRYEIREVLGRGGCGIVLKAFDDRLERVVAVKVMAPELAATSPARKRFLREARATALIRHENVVNIFDIEEHPLPFLVMEFIDGETLQQMIDRTGPLDVPDVFRIGQQIASGLAAAHEKGLIHRDIKPANILLDRGTGLLKITDFGLARSADDASMTQSGVIAGTPLYMSPEQAQSSSIDHRSDLFSLGSVLYYVCSGRPPFRAESTLAVLRRVVEDQPRPISEIIPDVPNSLTALIGRLHAKSPEKRVASIQEVRDQLERCSTEYRESTVRGNPVSSGKRRWAIAVAVGIVVLMGSGLTELSGITNIRSTMIGWSSPEGTIEIEADEPGVTVTSNDRQDAPANRDPTPPAVDDREDTSLNDSTERSHRDYDSFATGEWVPLLSTREDFDRHMAALKDTDYATEAEFIDGAVHCVSNHIYFPARKSKNFILRARVKNDGVSHHVNLRALHGDTGYVVFWNSSGDSPKFFGIGAAPASGWRDLQVGVFPDELPEFIEFALASIDHKLIVYIEGRTFLNVDLLMKDDEPLIAGLGGTVSRGIFKDIESMRLPDDAKWVMPKNGDPDYRAAIHALSVGDCVRVNGEDKEIWSVNALPSPPFKITYLSLVDRSYLKDVTDSDLAAFAECQDIEELQLHYLSEITGEGISHFRNCRSLRHLRLHGCRNVGPGLAAFSECEKLETIGLWDVPVTWEELLPLADKPFKEMNLGGTPFKDDWLEDLNLDHLEGITLSFTQVSDRGVGYLAQHGKHLRSVGLRHTKVTDAAVAELIAIDNLEELWLDHTSITNDGLLLLKQCSRLTFLDIRKTEVTADGVKELKQSLPECKIIWDGGTLEAADP